MLREAVNEMCGIAGTVNWGDLSTVECMAVALAHRGPDDRGMEYFPSERVGLSHRRLSILDLSKNGRQPMSYRDGRLWIVFNGEIYNFLQLRADLEARGHRFSSNSDTEVILHLYDEYGSASVKYLKGMFALALLDRDAGKLFLARDHFGIKPLYYYNLAGHFVFASEIKAILAANCCVREVDVQALYDYFTFSCIPSPNTIFKGIKQLPPAHTLEIQLDTGERRLSRYWDIGASREDGVTLGEEESLNHLRGLLAESVRSQLISDVPVGAFLSGGVDSRIMVGLMAEVMRKPVKTFTVIFEGEGLGFYNERDAARSTAERFGTEHHEMSVKIDHPEEMLGLVQNFDQPFANPTAYLMHLISHQARSEVKVALCGAGGDELFAGYPRYRAMNLSKLFRYIPNPAIYLIQSALKRLPDDYRTMGLRRARQFFDGLDSDFSRQFVKWTYYLDEAEKRDLLAPMLTGLKLRASERIFSRVFEKCGLKDQGNRVLATDVQTFLVDNLLEYTDKMSMSVGLEVRVPYLDREFAEYSMSMPFRTKLRGRSTKISLRKACRDLLPENDDAMPKKGFVPPLAIWMRDRLDRYFDRYMPRARTEELGYFDHEYIQTLRQTHKSGRGDYSYELFSILMFDSWHRHHLEGTATELT
jgi:asparagine synthase (glutamine-hydrolysing)